MIASWPWLRSFCQALKTASRVVVGSPARAPVEEGDARAVLDVTNGQSVVRPRGPRRWPTHVGSGPAAAHRTRRRPCPAR